MAEYAIGDIRRILSEIDRETLMLLQEEIVRVDDFFGRNERLENISGEIVNVWELPAILFTR